MVANPPTKEAERITRLWNDGRIAGLSEKESNQLISDYMCSTTDKDNDSVTDLEGDDWNSEIGGLDLLLEGRGSVRKPRSIAGFPDGTLAVYDFGDKSIKIFSPTGLFMYRIEGEFMKTRVPLAVTPDHELLIPYQQTLVLHLITADRHGPCTYRHVNTTTDLGKARDIAVSREIVVVCGMNKDDILFINKDTGIIIKRFDFSGKLENWQVGLQSDFSSIYFDQDRGCYVLDSDNNNIVFLPNEPTERVVCYCCDAWILRATRRHEFEQIDMILLCPKCVCVNRCGHVVVLEYMGKVKTLKLEGSDSGAIRREPQANRTSLTTGWWLADVPPEGTVGTYTMVGHGDAFKCY